MFIPRVVIIGNENELGKIDFEYQAVARFNGDEEFLPTANLQFDYIVCTNDELYQRWRDPLYYNGKISHWRVAKRSFFQKCISNIGFICLENLKSLVEMIILLDGDDRKIFSILDADGFFYRANLSTYPMEFFNIDSESQSWARKFSIDAILESKPEPIYENIYDGIFSNIDEIKLRYHDISIFTADRSLDEWFEIFERASRTSKIVIAFFHEDSEAFQNIDRISAGGVRIFTKTAERGCWFFIIPKRREDCQSYVVTHKRYFFPELPAGYELIQAGKKLHGIDLGILSDDIGENISEMNLMINEYTAIYWTWKNAPKTEYIGFAHYRRFFAYPNSSRDGEFHLGKMNRHILKMDEAKSILRDCDILVNAPVYNYSSLGKSPEEYFSSSAMDIAYRLLEKYIGIHQPDYLETFRKIESQPWLITNTIFFTRWNLFDEYCQWIFSFLIPAAQEFPESKFTDPWEIRALSFLAENLFMVFITHNRLKIKTLPLLRGARESLEGQLDLENWGQIVSTCL